jgi:hypothetical protein
MRWFFAGLLLTIFSLALAAEGLLIPENNPKPIYPKLLRAGVKARSGQFCRQGGWFGQRDQHCAK